MSHSQLKVQLFRMCLALNRSRDDKWTPIGVVVAAPPLGWPYLARAPRSTPLSRLCCHDAKVCSLTCETVESRRRAEWTSEVDRDKNDTLFRGRPNSGCSFSQFQPSLTQATQLGSSGRFVFVSSSRVASQWSNLCTDAETMHLCLCARVSASAARK